MNNPIRMQRAEANPKTNILMMSIIVLTGLAALFLDTEVVDHTPQILASIPSALDLRVLPSFKKCDFSIKEEVRGALRRECALERAGHCRSPRHFRT